MPVHDHDPAMRGTLGWAPPVAFGACRAVVLRGPTTMPPDQIIGPFESTTEARAWAEAHPCDGGFSVIQELPIERPMRTPGR